MYEDYVNLLRSISHKFRSSGIEFDDLMGVANESYMKAKQYYDENGDGKFSTLLYNQVKNDILIEIKRSRRWQSELSTEEIMEGNNWRPSSDSLNPEKRICFLSQLKSMSSEAQEVLTIILTSPPDLLKEIGSITHPRKFRGGLRRHLRKRKWSHGKIWKIFREIKEALK